MEYRKPSMGFIGLGLMGIGFTKCLRKAGFEIIGYDTSSSRIKLAERHGVVAAKSPKDVALNSDVVMICVTSSNDVERVVFGKGGIVLGKFKGKILIDCSTTDVEMTRKMSKLAKTKFGIRWIDAPVSGGPEAAEKGSLSVLVGGKKKDIVIMTVGMIVLQIKFLEGIQVQI